MTFHTVKVVKPNITTQPTAKLVALGSPFTLTTVVTEVIPTDSVPTYQWRKNGTAVPGATSASYVVPGAALSHAGSYDCVIKNASSTVPANVATTNAVQVGVADVAPKTLALQVGKPVTMTVNNAGSGLSFAWTKAHGTISATRWNVTPGTKTLTTTKLIAGDSPVGDSDTYFCDVTCSYAPKLTATFVLKVFNDTPVVTTTSLPDGVVAGAYSFQIMANPDSKLTPSSYAASGLPTGLTCSPTGLITGVPTVSSKFDGMTYSPFKVTLKAINAVGTGTSPVDLVIKPLSSKVVGTFNGLVDRNAGLGAGHGGKITLTVTATGSFTGSLAIGAETLPLTGKLDGTVTDATLSNFKVKRTGTLPMLTLNLSINGTTGDLTGSVTDGVVASPLVVQAKQNPWSSSITGTKVPAALATSYTTVLDIADSSLIGTDPASTPPGNVANVAYPQGRGYGTLTIGLDGTANWTGKMGDGVVASFATTMSSDGSVPMHVMLYTNMGAAHGWLKAKADSTMSPTNGGNSMLDGTIDWEKAGPASATDRVYKTGFAKHDLVAKGGKYTGPSAVTFLGLSAPPSNARIVFTEGGIAGPLTGPAPIPAAAVNAGSLNLVVSLSTSNAMTAVTSNPTGVTLTISGTTGAMSGAFTLKGDPDPTKPTTMVSRSVTYSGVLVSRLDLSIQNGFGCFVLSELPSTTAHTTLANSPQLAGKVVLGKP